MDPHANLAYSVVVTAPSPAVSGTSLTVAAGEGALFPAAVTSDPASAFNVTIWPSGQIPKKVNAEIARCTNRSGDVLTLVRAQEGTTARTVLSGDQIAATITAKTLTDIETRLARAAPAGKGELWFAGTAPTGWALLDGSTLSNAATSYPELYANVDPAWKSGNDIVLPDMRGRVPVGRGSHLDVNALGKNEGAAAGNRRPAHRHTVGAITHTLTLPDHGHSHGLTFAGTPNQLTGLENQAHNHNIPSFDTGVSGPAGGSVYISGTGTSGTENQNHNHYFTATGTIGGSIYGVTSFPAIGGSVGSPTVGPQTGAEPVDTAAYLVVNFIIWLGV